jgi:hypothetical protein
MKSLVNPQGHGMMVARIRKCTQLEFDIPKQYQVIKRVLEEIW